MSVPSLGNNKPAFLRRLKRILPLAVADIVSILVAYTSAYSVRMSAVPGYYLELQFVPYVILVTLASLYLYGGYSRIWERTSGHDVAVVLMASGTATLATAIPNYLIDPHPLPMSVVLVGNMLALTGFVAVRYRSRLVSGLKWRWRAVWHREFPQVPIRVLVVGAGDAGQTTAWRLKHRAPSNERGYRIVGFVDDDEAKHGMYLEGVQVLGRCEDIPLVAEKRAIDLIVVAIHNIPGPDFRKILTYCEQTRARIKLIPDVFAAIGETNGSPLLRDLEAEDLLGRQPIEWHQSIDVTPVTQKTILVTGAAGSIGSELCRQILRFNPVKLILLDNNESGLHDLVMALKTRSGADNLVPVLADITNRRALNRVFEEYRPQVIFHSAAYKHVPILEVYPDEAVRVNVGGTYQVAGLARDYQAERFVLISTDKAVNPTGVMGATKRICELMMHALAQQGGHQTYFTSVRFGNVLGSRGSVVPIFTRQIEAGGPVTVTHEEMSRYFMTIPEAVNLVIHAACLTQGDDVFMLRMGDEVRIVELAERMIRMRGLRPYHDIPIHFTGVRPGEKLHEELYDPSETLQPTSHPGLLELSSRRNGLRPVGFLDRINALFHTGLAGQDDPFRQLLDIISMGHDPESEGRVTVGEPGVDS
jgi:FlaA1/EpsC-like NDP-sugar epimerase